MIESVFQLLSGVLPFTFDDPNDIGKIAPGRLLAQDMEPVLQSSDGHRRRDVIRHTDEQNIQLLCQQTAEIRVVAHAVFERTLVLENTIADCDCLQIRVLIEEMTASFADHAVSGDPDTQFPGRDLGHLFLSRMLH